VARELGVDLAAVIGSGVGGRIIKRDILAAAAGGGRSTAPGRDQVIPFSRLRRHIGERTSLSSRTVPHFYLFADVDMTAALARRRRLSSRPGAGITITDLVIHAVAQSLLQFPHLNAHVEADSLVVKGTVHIGVATAVPDGLLLPVVPDAARKSLEQISAIRIKNAAAARRGIVSLVPQATFTISNIGAHDIDRVLPLINPPECAVLASGSVQERVVSRDRQPAVRDMMTVSLGCDHRVVDGLYAAQFLECLKGHLQRLGARHA
jgi:pyruvate dehydrogenase E2 component (dihydrolipoamide acetyltransferase)